MVDIHLLNANGLKQDSDHPFNCCL